jgi:hypothetical protein
MSFENAEKEVEHVGRRGKKKRQKVLIQSGLVPMSVSSSEAMDVGGGVNP